jgi:agmatinase
LKRPFSAHPKSYLNLPPALTRFDGAAVALLPVPYEGAVSWGKGAAEAPDWVIEASGYLELYDEVLKREPCRMGIVTVAPPELPRDPEAAQHVLYPFLRDLLDTGKLVVMLGGDHSISTSFVKALHERKSPLSVIQLDAHADLRETYEETRFSHACVMSRIREITPHTLQIGIRSMSLEEAKRVDGERIPLCTMRDFRKGAFDVKGALERLPNPVYITVDVDVFDWSVVRSTGTPEPGGLGWDEALALLETIFSMKAVAGFDVVELAKDPRDVSSPFAVAKLIYKMLGFRLAAVVGKGLTDWPDHPKGNVLGGYGLF